MRFITRADRHMITDQLAEAAVLLGVGMTVVFVFLTLLIGGIYSIAWFAKKFPGPDEAAHKNRRPTYSQNNKNYSTSTTVEPRIAEAIKAAVHSHRRKG
ncbi:MAG: oxaloacetate decarboxylase gamma subunit [Patiriisocius sp.]|jgi:oxaloacetate decarboxylase gamma subunit